MQTMPLLIFLVHLMVFKPLHLASPTGTGSGDKNECLSLAHLPETTLQEILSHLRPHQMSSVPRVNGFSHSACQAMVTEHYYLRGIPAYIPAMKRCMMLDDVNCFHFVNAHFRKENQEKKWRVAQLPALSYQFGAHNIRNALNLDENDPRAFSWTERANHHGEVRINRHRLVNTHEPATIYRFFNIAMYLNSLSRKIPQVLKSQIRFERYTPKYSPTMMKSSDYTPVHEVPTLHDIVAALALESLEERHAKFRDIRSRLEKVLSEGVYLLDDIFGSVRNTLLLWWEYGDNDDLVSRNFMQMLLDEGAPMDDRVVMADFSSCPSSAMSKYKKMSELAIRYSSGYQEASLARFLKTYGTDHWSFLFAKFNYRVAEALGSYHKLFPDIDFNAPFVVRSLAYFVSLKRATHENEQVIDFFLQKGLSKQDVLDAQESMLASELADELKTRLLEGFNRILKRTFLFVVQDPPR